MEDTDIKKRLNALEVQFNLKTSHYDKYMKEIGELVLSLSKNVQILSTMQEQEVVVFKKSYRDIMKRLKQDADVALSMNIGPIPPEQITD
jgi:hypothetical protein